MNAASTTPPPSTWKGTPVPDLADPIARTARLEAVARRVWWHGPPSVALRNANAFIWQVIDYGDDDDIKTAFDEIGRERWIRAIEAARPGRVSRCMVILWRTILDLPTEEVSRTWPDHLHRNDIRMFATEPRERMYERHRLAHERRVGDGEATPG